MSFPEEDIPCNRIIQELDKIKTKRTKKNSRYDLCKEV